MMDAMPCDILKLTGTPQTAAGREHRNQMAYRRNDPDRPQRADGKTTYDKLLDSALAIWAEDGIDRVTMNAVAERAGKTRGTVYHHFADREALVASLHTHLDERLTHIFDLTKAETRDDYLLVAGLMVDSPQLMRSYFSRLVNGDPTEDDLIGIARDHYRKLDALGWLRADIEPDHAAMISVSMWLASMLTVDLHEDPAARRAAAHAFARTFQTVMERSIIKSATERAALRNKMPR